MRRRRELPVFVCGVFYGGWEPSRTLEHARDLDSLLQRIASEARLAGETEASFAAPAANRVLSRHISAGDDHPWFWSRAPSSVPAPPPITDL